MSEDTSMTFEKALQELEAVVKQLEAGDLALEEALKAYEKGAALKLLCEDKLKKAQLRIDNISLSDKSSD